MRCDEANKAQNAGCVGPDVRLAYAPGLKSIAPDASCFYTPREFAGTEPNDWASNENRFTWTGRDIRSRLGVSERATLLLRRSPGASVRIRTPRNFAVLLSVQGAEKDDADRSSNGHQSVVGSGISSSWQYLWGDIVEESPHWRVSGTTIARPRSLSGNRDSPAALRVTVINYN